MIDIGLYKKSMKVGYLFWNKYKNDERECNGRMF